MEPTSAVGLPSKSAASFDPSANISSPSPQLADGAAPAANINPTVSSEAAQTAAVAAQPLDMAAIAADPFSKDSASSPEAHPADAAHGEPTADATAAVSPSHAPQPAADDHASHGHPQDRSTATGDAAARGQTPPPLDSSAGQENAHPHGGPPGSAASEGNHDNGGNASSLQQPHTDSPPARSPVGVPGGGQPHRNTYTSQSFVSSSSVHHTSSDVQPSSSGAGTPHGNSAAAAASADGSNSNGPASEFQVDPAFAGSTETVASEAELEAFCKLPVSERLLTGPLRGVLAEAALTGRVRYSWPLLRPLVDFVLEQALSSYEDTSDASEGPPKLSAYGGDSMADTIGRFKRLLAGFGRPPWTLQRLCELLLEPRKQYSQLHKVVLALEKCLLVTSEASLTPSALLPPLPALASLAPVNNNPASSYHQTHSNHRRHSSGSGHGGGRISPGSGSTSHHGSYPGSGPGGHQNTSGQGGVNRDVDESAAFTNSLIGPRLPHDTAGSDGGGNPFWAGAGSGGFGSGVTGHGNGPIEHMEEDHWPDAGPLLHPVIGHHLPQSTSPSGLQPPLLLHAHSPPSPATAGGLATSPTKAAADRHLHHHSQNHRDSALSPQQQHQQHQPLSPLQQQQQQSSPQQQQQPHSDTAFADIVPSTPPPTASPTAASPLSNRPLHAGSGSGASPAEAAPAGVDAGVSSADAVVGDSNELEGGGRHPLLEVLEAAQAAGVPSSPVLQQPHEQPSLSQQQDAQPLGQQHSGQEAQQQQLTSQEQPQQQGLHGVEDAQEEPMLEQPEAPGIMVEQLQQLQPSDQGQEQQEVLGDGPQAMDESSLADQGSDGMAIDTPASEAVSDQMDTDLPPS